METEWAGGEKDRLQFYLSVLKNQIDILEKKSGFSLKDKHPGHIRNGFIEYRDDGASL